MCGISSSAMRERLLREENLTLDKCLKICRAAELSRENSKTLQGLTVEEVHALKYAGEKSKDNEICCKFCGKTHERNKTKCPAFGKKCKKCGKDNHFAAMCKSRAENSRKYKAVHVVSEHDRDTCEDIMTISEVYGDNETINQVKERHSQGQQLFAGMMMDKNTG